MKKRMNFIVLICILSVIIIIIGFAAAGGRKPYKDLDSSQILSHYANMLLE